MLLRMWQELILELECLREGLAHRLGGLTWDLLVLIVMGVRMDPTIMALVLEDRRVAVDQLNHVG